MNRSLALGFLIGAALGAVGGALIAKPRAPEAPKTAAPPSAPPPVVQALPSPGDTLPHPELATLRARIAELEARLAKAPPPEAAPREGAEADLGALGERFGALAAKKLGALGDPELAALIAELKKKKGKGIEFLADKLLRSKSLDERFLAGAMIEGLKDPAAIPALSESLGKDDAGLVRRMSSHALAMIGTDASLPALRAAMAADKDWGVRVNSAYGVAKLGQADGATMLEEAYFSKEAAGYQAIIFGALADAAHASSAPFFRRVLTESTEIGYLLGSIGTLEKLKDTESVPLLNRIVSDATYDSAVREAAKKAVEALDK